MLSGDPSLDADEEEEADKINYESKILMGDKSQEYLVLFG